MEEFKMSIGKNATAVKSICVCTIFALLTLAGMASADTIWTGAGPDDNWGTGANWDTLAPPVYNDWTVIDNTDAIGVPRFNETVPNGIRGLAMGRYVAGNSGMIVENNTNPSGPHGVGNYGIYMGFVTGTHTLDINDYFIVSSGIRIGWEGEGDSVVNIGANGFLDMPSNAWIEMGRCNNDGVGDAPGYLNVAEGGRLVCGSIYVGDFGTAVLTNAGLIEIEDAGGSYPTLWAGIAGGSSGTVNLNGGFLYSKGFPKFDYQETGLSSGVINIDGGKLGTRDYSTAQADIEAAIAAGRFKGTGGSQNLADFHIVQIPAGLTRYKHNGDPQSIWVISSPPVACDVYVGPADAQDLTLEAGGSSTQIEYTVANYGATTSVNYTITETPDQPWLTLNKTAGGPVAANGGSDTITATIDPSALAAGNYTVDLVFADDCSAATMTRTINVEVLECANTITPQSTDLGNQLPGDIIVYANCRNDMDYTFTVTNTLGADRTYAIAEVDVGGNPTDHDWISIDKTSIGPLAEGSSDTLTVTVSPNATRDQQRFAYIKFTPDCGPEIIRTVLQDDTYIGDLYGYKRVYLGDVVPDTVDSCNFDPEDTSTPVTGTTCSFTVSDGVAYGTVVDDDSNPDPDYNAQNGKAFLLDQVNDPPSNYGAPNTRNGWASYIDNTDTTNSNSIINGRLGGTLVARVKVATSSAMGPILWQRDDAIGDPLPKQGYRVLWGGNGPGLPNQVREYLNDVTSDPLGLPKQDAYHIIRIASGWGSFGSTASLSSIYIWMDEDPTPVLVVDNAVSPAYYYKFDSFCFGTFGQSSASIIYFDWISFTNTGMWAPGQEDDCIGSLIPVITLCNDPKADSDGDGDVDQDDFAAFQACYTGTGGGVPDGCRCFNTDGDDDIDSTDLGKFEDCASGPAIPADPTCDDAP